MTRQEKIAHHIAARIVRNRSRKHFGSLYADALQEIMTNPTTSNMTVPSGIPVTTKQTDYKNLATGEDFRPQAADAVLPAQPAPRAADTDAALEGVGG